jgi:hypothetical protein
MILIILKGRFLQEAEPLVSLIFKYLIIVNKVKLILFALIALFVFLDGNYLVWFNSLYGEPMMITTLTLYIAAWVYYIYNRIILKSEEKVFVNILFIFVTAFLLLGSKMQMISALPIILFMQVKLYWENRTLLNRRQVWLLSLFICFQISERKSG